MKKIVILLVCLVGITSINATDCENCDDAKEEVNLKFEVQNDQENIQQQQEPQSEEHFVAVHVNQMNVDTLNPESQFIEDIVTPFLKNQFVFLYATNATREIVNGFKYEITFAMRDNESDYEIFCLLDVLEKPWLINNSKKFRKMTYNNCSLENPLDEDDRMRFEYEINPTFVNQRTEMSEDDMADMEDQIITERSTSAPLTTPLTPVEEITLSTLDPSSKNILDDFFNTNNYFQQPQTTATTTTEMPLFKMEEMVDVKKIENSQSQPMTSNESEVDELQQRTVENETLDKDRNDKALRELETEIKKAFSELFQSNSDFRMNIIALINRNDDSTAQKNYNYVVNILASKLKDKIESYNDRRFDEQVTVNPNEQILNRRKRSVTLSTPTNSFPSHEDEKQPVFSIVGGESPVDDHNDVQIYIDEAFAEINKKEEPDYTFKKVIKASKQVVSGILYRITTVSSLNDNEVKCELVVWEQAWLENGRKVDVTCDNNRIYSFNQNPVSQRTKRDTRLVGAPEPIEDHKEVKNLLTEHLQRLDTGSDSPLELVEIHHVTQQVVAGMKYIVDGTFKVDDEQKTCSVSIWRRSWISGDEGTKLEANCDGNLLKTKSSRKKRSATHHRRSHQMADHVNDHHHHHDRRHHSSASEQMKEVKSEILFDNFIQKYNRKYLNDEEHNLRMRIFKRNLHKIEMLNKHEQGTAKYGITEFADMTEKEYLHRTGLRVPERHENDLGNPIAHIPEVEDLPTEFDWREKSAVTDVKNQGNCGSCWSFSVTGNIEGLHAIKTGKLEAYSEQELLDCDTTDNACNGGYMDDAFKAIEKIGGLELEEEYPYQARKQKKCQFNATMSHVKVKGVVDIPKGDEVAMQKFLVSTGPISIGINANAMQFYRGGVSHPWKVLCRKSNLDHGVLIVGYGIKEYPLFNKTLPYWTIKNSWGPKWGEQGFYRVYRGDNTCGVAEMASSAVLDD